MKLIDADALCDERVCNDPVVIAAKCAPAVDAVQVVRCGKCKWKSKCVHHKPEEGGIFEDNDFCSYGERKDGAE